MFEVVFFCVGSCGIGNLIFNFVYLFFKLFGEFGNFVLRYFEGFVKINEIEVILVIKVIII